MCGPAQSHSSPFPPGRLVEIEPLSVRRFTRVPALVSVSLLACLFLGAMAVQAQAAPGVRWHKARRIEAAANGGFQAVSCPTFQLCVAGDASGHVLFTTRPSGGSWSRPAHVDGGNTLTGISCPTIHFCVAVDDVGNVLTSSRPTRGARGWSRPARIDSVRSVDGGYAGLLGISCPSTSLCVAVDAAEGGNLLTSTHPLGGARTWRMVHLGGTLASVSCHTTRLCVIAGSSHYYATHPAGGRIAWHNTGGPAGGGVLSGISCPSFGECVGVGFNDNTIGLADGTSSPTGGAKTWRTVNVGPSPPPPNASLLDAVGCAGLTLCVALDSADNAYVSSTPVKGGWSGPGPIRPNSASQQNAISCTLHLCVVVDSAGVEVTGSVHS